MTEISIKDYKIHNLQKEYNRYSNIFFNLQNHVNRLYNDGILNINDRNNNLKELNDLLRQMNNNYNKYMMETCESENNIDKDCTTDSNDNILNRLIPVVDASIIQNSTFDNINSLINFNKSIQTDNKEDYKKILNIINEPFININSKLLKICLKIGFETICDTLNIIIGEQFEKMFEKEFLSKLNIYNRLFIPIKYNISRMSNKEPFFFKKIPPFNEIILDNCADIYVKHGNNYIVLTGYFTYDSLNIVIKTSQICHNFIFQKKKDIEYYVNNYDNISEKFKKSYIRNCTIRDIIVLTKEEFGNKLEIDYHKFRHLTKLTFMNQMKEFVENNNSVDSITNMYNIIRLLLLGVEHNINIAGLLFSLTENQKIGSEKISSILYKNLNYTLQIKLKKSSINIKNELEKIKAVSIDEIDLKKQIAICKYMPTYVKKCALEKIEEMKASNNEYYKQLLYVKTLINYPWPSTEDDTFFKDLGKDDIKSRKYLDGMIEKLDEKVYGHKTTKSLIKEIIGKWIKNPSSSGSSIGLVGPPGVGKTLIAKSIGEALNIPFVQITLGGQNDGEILHGHGYTYSGSQPGMVVKKMVEAGNARCIMFFDELDKTAKKHDTNEIYNILIHMTDPNTNRDFQDRFFQEINFPLNKVIFIFSYNNSNLIEPILIDRITEISTEPYSLNDKINIVKDFTLKEMTTMVGFEDKSVIIKNPEVKYIIEDYTNEAGVRELKRKIEKIFMKLNIDRIYGKNLFAKNMTYDEEDPIIIDKDTIISYLSKPKSSIQFIHKKHKVGVINGLYATDSGHGGIIPIQVYINHTGHTDKFVLKMTGHQGKVMKESVESAFTAAIHHIKDSVRDDFLQRNPYGLHIHTPSGSVPKEGPSAGCAFATAFISVILNAKIRNNIAMTGEIDLTGKVTEIGGLQYKLNGAKKAGIKLVLVSKENEDDVIKIKKENPGLINRSFRVVLVEKISDVLKHALVKYDSSNIVI